MSIPALQQGPSEVIEHLNLNSELLNIPAIGVETNKYFPATQLNLAPAEPSTSSKFFLPVLSTDIKDIVSENSLGLSLGGAGVEQYDKMDHSGYFTHIVVVSDIPKSYHPGLFFLFYPGIFIVLSNFTSIMFLGLCKHRGHPSNCTLWKSTVKTQFSHLSYSSYVPANWPSHHIPKSGY